MQNSSLPPPYQDIHRQATSQTMSNYSSYTRNPTSPNAGFYVPPPNNPPYDASPLPHPQYAAPPTNSHYTPPPLSPGYSSPPAPPASSPYPSQHQPPGQDSSRHSTSLRSLLGSAIKGSNLPRAIQSFSLLQFRISSSTRPKRDIPNGRNGASAPNGAGQVIVNQQPLDQQSLLCLEMMGVRTVPGRYW
jgi:hypothetical protein